MSFDLPERSPLATLSIIDLSCSQVTCPHSSSLLWPCLEHPCAQPAEDFRAEWDLALRFAQSSPRRCRGGHSINQALFRVFKIQAPFPVKPCVLRTPPSLAAELG